MNSESAPSTRTARLISELRRAGIGDARVLAAMAETPRDLFVPEPLQSEAYDNVALPIGNGQAISQPYVVALMTEQLALTGQEKILEVGTGSGYQAAILARLARQVFTVERHRVLVREAERRFAALRLDNIETRFGDGTKGWPRQAPFDRIIVTAAAPELPVALLDQLAPAGIMVLPVGAENRDQKLLLVRRHGTGFETEALADVRFVPLVAGLPRLHDDANREAGGAADGMDSGFVHEAFAVD